MYADPSDQNACSVNNMNLRKKIKLKFIQILKIHSHLFMTMNCSGLNQVDLIFAFIHVCHNRMPTVFLSWWGEAAFFLVPPFRDNELLWPESSYINSFMYLIAINWFISTFFLVSAILKESFGKYMIVSQKSFWALRT